MTDLLCGYYVWPMTYEDTLEYLIVSLATKTVTMYSQAGKQQYNAITRK